MRKALSGILVSLFTSAALVGLSSPVKAEENVRGYSSKNGVIQPFARSDREMMNPKNTDRPSENGNPPGGKATVDSHSYRHPSQRPHRFGAGISPDFYRFRPGR